MAHRPTRRGLIAATLAVPAIAQAQGADWRPDRQITMIVAFAPGGGTDAAARTIARFMERDLGQPVVVLNRPGAGGEIGFSELARARARWLHDRLHQHAHHRHHPDRAPRPLQAG
jgi:tripartite-type tricarboxylate transporter receptor subunit TctC